MAIQGFEDYSESLTKMEELEVVPLLVEKLNSLDLEQFVKTEELRDYINERCEREQIVNYCCKSKNSKKIYKVDREGVKLRKMIYFIRKHDLVQKGILIANQKGYKLSLKREEIEKYIHSCKQRGESFFNTASLTEINYKNRLKNSQP